MTRVWVPIVVCFRVCGMRRLKLLPALVASVLVARALAQEDGCGPGRYDTVGYDAQNPTRDTLPCTDCPTGKFKAVGYASNCSYCVPGQFQNIDDKGLLFCRPCPGGKHKDNAAVNVCSDCPMDTFSVNAQPTCTLCPPGRRSDPGQAECEGCAAGRFSQKGGLSPLAIHGSVGGEPVAVNFTVCESCAPGRHNPTVGSPICTSCPRGQYGVVASALGQLEANCSICLAGRFQPGSSLTSCTACDVGKFSAFPGAYMQSNCTLCPTGKFAVPLLPAGKFAVALTIGASRCEACARGKWSSSPGAKAWQVPSPTTPAPRTTRLLAQRTRGEAYSSAGTLQHTLTAPPRQASRSPRSACCAAPAVSPRSWPPPRGPSAASAQPAAPAPRAPPSASRAPPVTSRSEPRLCRSTPFDSVVRVC